MVRVDDSFWRVTVHSLYLSLIGQERPDYYRAFVVHLVVYSRAKGVRYITIR